MTGPGEGDLLGLVGQRTGGLRAVARGCEEDAAHLEQCDVDQPLVAVARHRAQQPGEHRGAQHRLLGAQRVGGPHQPVERSTGPFEVGGRHQRQGDRLGEPHPHERVGHEAPFPLAHGERADLPAGVGQRAPDAVEANAAGHLLDEVDLAVEVGAEGGDDRDDGVAGVAGRGCVIFRRALSSSMPSGARPRSPHVFGVEGGAEHRIDAVTPAA